MQAGDLGEFSGLMARLWAVFGHGGAVDPVLIEEWWQEFSHARIEDLEATYLAVRGREDPKGFPRPAQFREWYGELANARKLPSQRDPRETVGAIEGGHLTPPDEALKRIEEIKQHIAKAVQA